MADANVYEVILIYSPVDVGSFRRQEHRVLVRVRSLSAIHTEETSCRVCFLWLMPAQCHIRVRARERRLRISVPSLRRIEYHQGWWVRGLILVKDDAWTSVSHAELEFFVNRQNRPPDPGGIRRVLYEAGFEPNGECYYCGRTVGIGSYFCPGHDSTFTQAWFRNPALWPILAEAVRIHVAN